MRFTKRYNGVVDLRKATRVLALSLVGCGRIASLPPDAASADAAADVAADSQSPDSAAICLPVPSRDAECPSTSPHAFTCNAGGCVDESARGLWCCR